MHFNLVDAVLEHSPGAAAAGGRIVTIKQVSAAEEYLQDHFPGFPVLPGVMMIEAMVQAGRRLVESGAGSGGGGGGGEQGRMVLGGVRALKYGRFVKPGETLRVEVSVVKELDGGAVELKGQGTVIRADGSPADGAAVSGRFTLRPVRLGRSNG